MRANVTRNMVLQRLAQADRRAWATLAGQLEAVSLEQGVVLNGSSGQGDWSYFVESGLVALVVTTRAGNTVEVGLVGRDGVAGFAGALGGRTLPYRMIVQLPGLAYRAPTALIREHILTCSALHEILMDSSQRLMQQLAQSAVCSRFHGVLQRLARWLLVTGERAETQRFQVTHEFAAQMLGAPRSAVTAAAAALRSRGIIDYRRGVLTIRSLRRLERVACECYEVSRLSDEPLAA